MPAATLDRLLDRLERLKTSFLPGDAARTALFLDRIARRRFTTAISLIRCHEALLFLRAYPKDSALLRKADEILSSFADRIAQSEAAGDDTAPLSEPEVSGIAGSSLTAVFSYPMARWLAGKHPREISLDWDSYDSQEQMGHFLRRSIPLLDEDSMVEANIPWREWLHAAGAPLRKDLPQVLSALESLALAPLEKSELYDALKLPVRWDIGNSRLSRSRMRIPARRIFFHTEPLLRRSEVSVASELAAPPIPATRLSKKSGQRMLELARETSAQRYRELHGFTYGDPLHVYRAHLGRGVEAFVSGVPPEWRLPLRAYHAASIFKNGVPIGYVEGLSLLDRMEIGFNLYYTFREGESAWLYARLLRLFHQMLGITCFSVDPYQVGFHNEEAIDSGAFWFYRKLGFRPVEPGAAALTEAEERKIAKRPGYRSSASVLRKLSEGAMVYEVPGSPVGEWDRFQVRRLCLAVQKAAAGRGEGGAATERAAAASSVSQALDLDLSSWTPPERAAFGNLALILQCSSGLRHWTAAERESLAKVARAKVAPEEVLFLRLMRKHARLRAAVLALGSDQVRRVRPPEQN